MLHLPVSGGNPRTATGAIAATVSIQEHNNHDTYAAAT